MLSGTIGVILVGLIVGVLARAIKPGADPMGWILTIILGVAGSFIGSYFFKTGIMHWVASVGVAIALLFLYEMLRKKSK